MSWTFHPGTLDRGVNDGVRAGDTAQKTVLGPTLARHKLLTPHHRHDATAANFEEHPLTHRQILLFEDQTVVESLKKNIPIYAHHFGDWSEHTNAMHAFALWTALEAEGFGANLQHYNPVVDDKVRDQWKVPAEWKLRAQLVFGGRAGPPPEKTFEPLEKKVQVRGAKM